MAPLLTSSRTISGCWRAALDYLDAAVLRLSDAVGRRYAQVVLAASGDHETGLRHPILHQHGGDGVGPALGQSLVVIGRAGGVGIPGDLQGHRRPRAVGVCRLPDYLLPARTDDSTVPVKEDQVHGGRRRRRRRGSDWWRWRRRATAIISS